MACLKFFCIYSQAEDQRQITPRREVYIKKNLKCLDKSCIFSITFHKTSKPVPRSLPPSLSLSLSHVCAYVMCMCVCVSVVHAT